MKQHVDRIEYIVLKRGDRFKPPFHSKKSLLINNLDSDKDVDNYPFPVLWYA